MSVRKDGATLTAAAAASCLPSEGKVTLDPAFFDCVGKTLEIKASGRISCVITTPGTARFDIRFGSTIVFERTTARPSRSTSGTTTSCASIAPIA